MMDDISPPELTSFFCT